MTLAAPTLIEHDRRMLDEMVGCAHAFGMAFAAEAEVAGDPVARREAFERFDRCFLAVRMGIRLKLRLAQQRPAAAAAITLQTEREYETPEAADRDETEGIEREVDRERDRESVSLPAFLKTLGVIQSDAARLGEALPAHLRNETLSTLSKLLALANTAGATQTLAPQAPARQFPAHRGLDRSRLASGASATALLLDRPVGAKQPTARLRPLNTGPRPTRRPP